MRRKTKSFLEKAYEVAMRDLASAMKWGKSMDVNKALDHAIQIDFEREIARQRRRKKRKRR